MQASNILKRLFLKLCLLIALIFNTFLAFSQEHQETKQLYANEVAEPDLTSPVVNSQWYCSVNGKPWQKIDKTFRTVRDIGQPHQN